jgi:hypothetical protein
MSRYYAIAAALSALLSVLLLWSTGIHSTMFLPRDASGPTPGSPQLRVTQWRQDLGTLREGQLGRATFHVANDGTRRLVIRRETGRCCGQSGAEDITLIPPGGTATLVVEVDPAGIRGGLQQEITYATNDPRMPEFRLTVVGRVAGDDDSR